MHFPVQADVESTPYPLARLMMYEWITAAYNEPPNEPIPCIITEMYEAVPADGYSSHASDMSNSFILYSMYQNKLIDRETLEAWIRLQYGNSGDRYPDYRRVSKALRELDVFDEFGFDQSDFDWPFFRFSKRLSSAFYGFFEKIGEPGYPTFAESVQIPFYSWLVNIEEEYVDDFKMTLERLVTFHLRYSFLEVDVRYWDDATIYDMFHEPYSNYLDKLAEYSIHCEGIDLTRQTDLPDDYVRFIHYYNSLRGGGFSCITSR